MYGCRKCDFDICEKCFEDEKIVEVGKDDLELVEFFLKQSTNLKKQYKSVILQEFVELANKKKNIIKKNQEKQDKREQVKNLKQFRKLLYNKSLDNDAEFFKKLQQSEQRDYIRKVRTDSKNCKCR